MGIEGSFRETDLALQGGVAVGGGEEFGGAVETEVVGAGENEHVLGLQGADGASFVVCLVHAF